MDFLMTKAHKIVLGRGYLSRMWLQDDMVPVHVLSLAVQIMEIGGSVCPSHDILVPTINVRNEEIPEILDRFEMTYPGEHVYMFIRTIESVISNVGFVSCAEELVYNPHGSINDDNTKGEKDE